MPTLLRSNAAAGVAMGLDSHLKELDRTEMQRQFDMSRRDKARGVQAMLLAKMLEKDSNTATEVSDGRGGKMKMGDLIPDFMANYGNDATSRRWFDDDNGAPFPRNPDVIYKVGKSQEVTPGSRSKEIIKGSK